MKAPGGTDAAVLVPIFGHPEQTGLVFTERRADLRRLVRRGLPIRTPTYVVGEHLIWGATARILGELLGRLGGPAGPTRPSRSA